MRPNREKRQTKSSTSLCSSGVMGDMLSWRWNV